MIGVLGVVGLLVLVFSLVTALSRANEVFCLSYREGRLLLIRGSLPGALLRDFREVLRERPSPRPLLLKGFVHDGVPSLVTTGADESLSQQLRNLIFLQTPSSLAPAAKPPRRTWWRVLGFVWLAWWMQGRDEETPSNITRFRR